MCRRLVRLLLCCFLIRGSPLIAQDEPTALASAARDYSLWEAGLLGGTAYLPDYPAAGQNHMKWIAAPFLIYRGKVLRADREGARARFIRQRYFDLEMSFSGSFPASSEDNDARRGMPDLDYLLELGPRASIALSDLGGRGRMRLFVPLRAVLSSDLTNLKHRGFTLTPALYARWNDFLRRDWLLIAQLSANFGDRPMNAYFYDVPAAFATPARPAYDARTGYMGSDLFAGVVVPFGLRWRLFTGAQLAYHEGSANAPSPLFINRLNATYVFGLSWTFYQSPRPAVPL